MSKKRKKSLVGWLPNGWDLIFMERYTKVSACPVSKSRYNEFWFYHPVRKEKFCNDDSEVRVRITIQEI